jgi:hypothetical protein
VYLCVLVSVTIAVSFPASAATGIASKVNIVTITIFLGENIILLPLYLLSACFPAKSFQHPDTFTTLPQNAFYRYEYSLAHIKQTTIAIFK